MKRSFLPVLGLLLALWAQPAFSQQTGPPNQILCNKQAIATISTATTTSLVAGIAGSGPAGTLNQGINICGWHVTTSNSANASTFQLIYGAQGGPCTSPTNLTPAFSVTSTAPSSDHIEFATMVAPQTVVPAAANQLCVVSTGATVQLSILVYYSQF